MTIVLLMACAITVVALIIAVGRIKELEMECDRLNGMCRRYISDLIKLQRLQNERKRETENEPDWLSDPDWWKKQ